MTDINPLTGAVIGSALVGSQAGLVKQRQVRRAQSLRKDSASREDTFEQQVESTEELVGVHERKEESQKRRDPSGQKKGDPQDPTRPQIDMTA